MPHYAVYKPYGVLSQFTPEKEGQRTLGDLPFPFPKDVYPIGRLDADSEGLLLLSNDKSANYKLLNPHTKTPKTYLVQVEGIPAESDLDKLRSGVAIRIDGKVHHTLPAVVVLLEAAPLLPPREPPIRVRQTVPDCWLQIQITEGKNRQIRRMCAAIGFPVLRLVRTGFGKLALGAGELKSMQPGTVVQLHKIW